MGEGGRGHGDPPQGDGWHADDHRVVPGSVPSGDLQAICGHRWGRLGRISYTTTKSWVTPGTPGRYRRAEKITVSGHTNHMGQKGWISRGCLDDRAAGSSTMPTV